MKLSSGFYVALALLLPAAIWQLQRFLQWRGRIAVSGRRKSFNERGIDRLEDRWRGEGSTGLAFAREHHLYEWDLDILGEGSLFELLATTRTEVGAERLADYLLDQTTIHESRARQNAVKELHGAVSLREDIAILGRYQFLNCRREHLQKWLETPILTVPRFVPVFLTSSNIVCILLGLCGNFAVLPWVQIAPIGLLLLLVQAGIGLVLMRRVRARIHALLPLVGEVALLREGLELAGRQDFQCRKLRELVERVSTEHAKQALRKLERSLRVLDRREDFMLYAALLWLAAGTQLILAIERWRAKHQQDFEEWLNAWSEFEALNALACYSWEHPHHVFPELVDEGACFEAEGLGHPLLPVDRCIGNDVSLNASHAFYVISGSNMAGKSTFLRAIGVAAVLASAGAPVCALRARVSGLRVCASLSMADSLLDGKSKFLAEVERLRDAIQVAQEGCPVLFLIDEILSGTNSRDRRVAAEAVLEELVAAGAVGALSTHDLSLTEIGERVELRGQNVHMESESRDDPLVFDYRVKPGISRQTNALAIVRMLGIQR
jgi:Mrp family chromosome partitioning ATPase